MTAEFLGKIKYSEALAAQERAWSRVVAGEGPIVLGFESEAVVTLGLRGDPQADLQVSRDSLREKGFEILHVDRGGQATLHHRGQLVIFPVADVRAMGAKRWAGRLAEITRRCLADFGVTAQWDECRPGLYTERGKIMAMGLRVRQGISTHGLAINVSNALEDFELIRACGRSAAAVDRFPEPVALIEVFQRWNACFAIDMNPDSYKKES